MKLIYLLLFLLIISCGIQKKTICIYQKLDITDNGKPIYMAFEYPEFTPYVYFSISNDSLQQNEIYTYYPRLDSVVFIGINHLTVNIKK